jgi:two-component system sensor histidine kinase CiaH
MNTSFGEGYISQVRDRQDSQQSKAFDETNTQVATIAGDVALGQLRTILLGLNGILLVVIPAASWFLAKRTLLPIQQMHVRQKQFVSHASHELRTPLAIMHAEFEQSQKRTQTLIDYQKTIASADEEVKYLTSLVESLLFLARDNTQMAASPQEIVDLTDIISNTIARFSHLITSKHLLLTYQPDTESSLVRGSSAMLQQLCTNLLDNAVKFTPNHGTIRITLTQTASSIILTMFNSGIGITPKDEGHIFEEFYRADEARSGRQGYGLGLSIVALIVQQHRGAINTTSQPGSGVTFEVTLAKAL